RVLRGRPAPAVRPRPPDPEGPGRGDLSRSPQPRRAARTGEGMTAEGTTAAPAKLGTRRSTMATTQSQRLADTATEPTGQPIELQLVTSSGAVTKAHLPQLGGPGLFVNALRDALVAGTTASAVHSLKALPTAPAEGLVLAASPE